MTIRSLSDYCDENGQPPDGLDNEIDDTSAIVKALAGGPGVVRIGPGFYRWGAVEVPSQVTVEGAGLATVVRSSGPKTHFLAEGH